MRYRKVHFFVICIAPFTILREEVALWRMAPPPSASAAAGENTPAAHRQTIGNDGTQSQRLRSGNNRSMPVRLRSGKPLETAGRKT